jgi:tight adherence protein C
MALLVVLLFAVSTVLVLRAIMLPRMRAQERVETIRLYGFDSGLSEPVADAPSPTFADLAGRIGDALGRRFSSMRPESRRRELLAAGLYQLSPGALLGYRVLSLLVFGTLGVVVATGISSPVKGFLFAFVVVGLGWMAPLVAVRRRARFRMDAVDRSLPDLIDMLVSTVEAGLGLGAALQLASGRFEGPLGQELRLMMQQQRMGRTLGETLDQFLVRIETPSTRSFVRSLSQGETLGVSVGSILRGLAEEMRKRRRKSAEEQAQKAPVKMLFPLAFLVLPAFGVVILGPAVINIVHTLGSF